MSFLQFIPFSISFWREFRIRPSASSFVRAGHKRTGEYASQEVTPGTAPNWHREIGEDEDEGTWDEQQWLAMEIASEATQEMGNG